jgi:DNA polymerase I-like protein with 3'-5' exonuclease and polymerase domains
VQSLAGIITMDAGLEIKKMGLAMQVHDELVFVVPDEQVAEFKQIATAAMRRLPAWAPTLPFEAEAGTGRSYGES